MDLGSLVRRLVRPARSEAASPPIAVTAGEWRSLPPIRRTAGAAPLVAPNAPFRDGLATTQPPPVALATLGHERRLEAPAGLATGIATPVQRAPAEPLPSSVRRPDARRPDTRRTTGHAEPAGDAITPAAVGAAGDPPTESIVPSAAAPPPGPNPLVSSPPVGPRPTGLVGTAAVSRFVAVQPPAPVAFPPADAGATTPAAQPVIARTDGGSHAVGTAPVAGAPPLVARRVRLGPPVHPPVAAAPQAGPPAAQRAVAAVEPARDQAGAATTATGAGHDITPGGHPDTTTAASLVTAVPEAPAVPAASVVPLHRPIVARAAIAPLVGRLRPSVDTRAPTAVPTTVPGPPAAAPEDAGGPAAALAALARVDPTGGGAWAPGPSDGPAAIPGRGSGPAPASGSATAGGIAGLPTVARAAGPGATPSVEAGTRLTWANPWVPSATPGTVPSATPGAVPPNAAVSESVAQVPGRSPASPFVPRPHGGRVGPAIQRRTDDPGDRRSRPDAPGATTPASGDPVTATMAGGPDSPALPVVARLADPGFSPAESLPVQRAEATAAPAESAGGSAAAGSAPGAPGSPTAEKELDDLARRLYDRIGLRLRRDLLVERERAGALVDRGF